jgi:uracil-DNA glycosylase family 4
MGKRPAEKRATSAVSSVIWGGSSDPPGLAGADGATAGELDLTVVTRRIIACTRCPELRAYCRKVALEKKRAHRDEVYWGRPVPGFGDAAARVLVVGLAPAAHGANRTGRVFTGDGSGDFLMRALYDAGFANQPTSRAASDGLRLEDVYIAAAVRCAPPANKPTLQEISACRPHLAAELAALARVRVLVALGRIAFDACLSLLADRHPSGVGTPSVGAPVRPRPRFGHGAAYRFGGGIPALIASYHPSRQNTNTGRLTPPMLLRVFEEARRVIAAETTECDAQDTQRGNVPQKAPNARN